MKNFFITMVALFLCAPAFSQNCTEKYCFAQIEESQDLSDDVSYTINSLVSVPCQYNEGSLCNGGCHPDSTEYSYGCKFDIDWFIDADSSDYNPYGDDVTPILTGMDMITYYNMVGVTKGAYCDCLDKGQLANMFANVAFPNSLFWGLWQNTGGIGIVFELCCDSQEVWLFSLGTAEGYDSQGQYFNKVTHDLGHVVLKCTSCMTDGEAGEQ